MFAAGEWGHEGTPMNTKDVNGKNGKKNIANVLMRENSWPNPMFAAGKWGHEGTRINTKNMNLTAS